jgi:hypothetical protein
MLCIKHNDGAGFARSPVGPRGKTFKKAHKSAHLRSEFLISRFWFRERIRFSEPPCVGGCMEGKEVPAGRLYEAEEDGGGGSRVRSPHQRNLKFWNTEHRSAFARLRRDKTLSIE